MKEMEKKEQLPSDPYCLETAKKLMAQGYLGTLPSSWKTATKEDMEKKQLPIKTDCSSEFEALLTDYTYPSDPVKPSISKPTIVSKPVLARMVTVDGVDLIVVLNLTATTCLCDVYPALVKVQTTEYLLEDSSYLSHLAKELVFRFAQVIAKKVFGQ